jgi:hypothetical protein
VRPPLRCAHFPREHRHIEVSTVRYCSPPGAMRVRGHRPPPTGPAIFVSQFNGHTSFCDPDLRRLDHPPNQGSGPRGRISAENSGKIDEVFGHAARCPSLDPSYVELVVGLYAGVFAMARLHFYAQVCSCLRFLWPARTHLRDVILDNSISRPICRF